jgi:hypothetical protein
VPQATKISKRERAILRQLALRAWELELEAELETLYEEFGHWADKGMSAFDLSDKIHEFHDGSSRELYSIYMRLDPTITVSRAVARGVLSESDVGSVLIEKLAIQIAGFREAPDDSR